jgi:hypothetical protein
LVIDNEPALTMMILVPIGNVSEGEMSEDSGRRYATPD